MLIEGIVIDELGRDIPVKGSITKAKAESLAKKNHRVCNGRGWLSFDDGKVFMRNDGTWRVMNQWLSACLCVEKKLGIYVNNTPKRSHHPASKRPLFQGKK